MSDQSVSELENTKSEFMTWDTKAKTETERRRMQKSSSRRSGAFRITKCWKAPFQCYMKRETEGLCFQMFYLVMLTACYVASTCHQHKVPVPAEIATMKLLV